MWWKRPRSPGAVSPLLPPNVLDVLVRAYAIVEVGGVGGVGPERGRNFEQLFYKICDRLGVHLTEKAGGRSVAGQRSASGFAHEVDAATRSASATTYWELKHLSSPLEKNELLIFNGKALDYLYDARPIFRAVPLLRFLLSGRNIRDDCRVFAVQWGITVIEPGRLVIPFLYEAAARGYGVELSKVDQDAIRQLAPWACRPLQIVVHDVASRCAKSQSASLTSVAGRAKEVIEMQEQIGKDMLDAIEEQHPDWVNDLAQEVWIEVGGWS
jgi:hypothetical protein